MPRLSVAIICPDDGHQFEDTLVSVLEHAPAAGDCEIIVAYPGHYADPYDIRQEVTVLELPGCPSTAELMNAALDTSAGEFLCYLRAGLRVASEWHLAVEAFENDRCGAVAPIVLSDEEDGQCLGSMQWRWHATATLVDGRRSQRLQTPDHGHIVAPCLHAAWYRRSVLLHAGGWDRQLPESTLTLDMAMAMKRCGYECIVARDLHVRGTPVGLTAASGFRQGLAWERLFWKHRKNVGRWGMLQHFMAIAAEAIASPVRPRLIPRLAGRFVTWLQLPLFAAETMAVEEESPIDANDDSPAADSTLDCRAA